MSGMVSFRVRRPYFNAIKGGTKTVEVRRHSPYWVAAMNRGPREAVFVCGKDVHRRGIRVILTAGSVQAPAVQACLPADMRGKVSEEVGEGPVIAYRGGAGGGAAEEAQEAPWAAAQGAPGASRGYLNGPRLGAEPIYPPPV